MLHRAEFRAYPGGHQPAIQMGSFIRSCNLERENIINVQEMADGVIILWYWQEIYHR